MYSTGMWMKVALTHRAGTRLKAGETHPRGQLEGEIRSYAVGRRRSHVLSLRFDVQGSDLAQLYAVQLVGIGPNVFRVSGLERSGSAWVRQEWICELAERPEDLPGEPSRYRRP